MKTRILTITAGAIAAALLAPAALAEPDVGKGKRPGGKRPGGPGCPGGDRPSREEIMEKFDENEDGKLDTAERVQMIKTRMEKNEKFAEMVNKRFGGDDGVASDEEIAAFAEKMGQHRRRGPRGPGRPGGKRPGGKRPEGERPEAEGESEGFKPAAK